MQSVNPGSRALLLLITRRFFPSSDSDRCQYGKVGLGGWLDTDIVYRERLAVYSNLVDVSNAVITKPSSQLHEAT